eukprot:c39483_g1_i1.p1 GENE.c39483_g1_i1~~c39483_g1_i1.p1  ORF type:complete len:1160 (+),score=325.66 c39483_g1_i1:51-3482(+)
MADKNRSEPIPRRGSKKVKSSTAQPKNKEDTLAHVSDLLHDSMLCPGTIVQTSTPFFFNQLGLPNAYFEKNSARDISEHILCLEAAKTFSEASGSQFVINIRREDPDKAIFIVNADESPEMAAHRLQEWREAFDSFDLNRTGKITPDDLEKALIKAGYMASEKEVADIVAVCDLNGDGVIDFSEFVSWMERDDEGDISREVEGRIEMRYLGEGIDWKDQGPAGLEVRHEGLRDKMKKIIKRARSNSKGDEAKAIPPWEGKFRFSAYRTANTVSDSIKIHLWFYLVERAVFLNQLPPEEEGLESKPTSIAPFSCTQYNLLSTPEEQAAQLRILEKVVAQMGPFFELLAEEDNTHMLTLGCRAGSSPFFLSALTDLLNYHRFTAHYKNVEPLGHYVTLQVLLSPEAANDAYLALKQANNDAVPWTQRFLDDVSFVFVIPTHPFSHLFHRRTLSAYGACYAYIASLFLFYFFGQPSHRNLADLRVLRDQLRDNNANAKLTNIFQSHQLTSWSEQRIREAMSHYPALLEILADHFKSLHASTRVTKNDNPDQLRDSLRTSIGHLTDDFEREVLLKCLEFNTSVYKTNLWKRQKSALVLDINPAVTDPFKDRYPDRPYCIFMVVGQDFRGFHVRFNDVARGGVRLVKSSSTAEWAKNATSLFNENYRLAHTQHNKNKDIPEGGAKGVLLVLPNQRKFSSCFKRYIDAILDMLDENQTKSRMLSRDPKIGTERDILFVGPDENTAEVMDWAAEYAKKRGYATWKAFTTGKGGHLGGIPHDKYGMTTRGVRRYVLGALEHMLKKRPEEVTKCQTGGPDGDLGSNEILESQETLIAIVDGSGVLYDGAGLNREELVRLATDRLMTEHFDTRKLSKSGFMVNIKDKHVKLPNGSLVEDGRVFRDNFHLHPLFTADVFVPCGGRPSAVNMSNIAQFSKITDDSGTRKRFSLIVEGANLFFEQDARLVLEELGVILFKDAAANKGGVTSSSLEVLVALALSDEDHQRLMCSKGGVVPEFYKKYTESIQTKIEHNADREFFCLSKENLATRKPISVLVDQVSAKINKLAGLVRNAPLLYDDKDLRQVVFSAAVPTLLLDQVGGVEGLIARVPDRYCRWIFASYLASDYVYSTGLRTTEFTFMTFVEELKHRAAQK